MHELVIFLHTFRCGCLAVTFDCEDNQLLIISKVRQSIGHDCNDVNVADTHCWFHKRVELGIDLNAADWRCL